jgi:ABC-type bacteriocin/lantibiotic exporter with double-glycine peptidase domain
LGVVLQDNKITAGSIFENIASGSLCTMEDAWSAARAAAFDVDIEAMPMKMHTTISEGGGNLSGGQRQRLLIARALVLKPSILIFDEATSALDNRTQTVVTESLRQLKITTILVAHRLSTIRHAARIYVIDGGRVVQNGTFDELSREAGLFAKLIARQLM